MKKSPAMPGFSLETKIMRFALDSEVAMRQPSRADILAINTAVSRVQEYGLTPLAQAQSGRLALLIRTVLRSGTPPYASSDRFASAVSFRDIDPEYG
jgi:hypothetical protein